MLLVADGSARDGKATPDGQIDGAQGHNINNDFDRMGSGWIPEIIDKVSNRSARVRGAAGRCISLIPLSVSGIVRYLDSRESCITYAMPGRGHMWIMVVGEGPIYARCAAAARLYFSPADEGESCEWRPASAQWAVPTRAEFTECRNSYPYYSALLNYTPMRPKSVKCYCC